METAVGPGVVGLAVCGKSQLQTNAVVYAETEVVAVVSA